MWLKYWRLGILETTFLRNQLNFSTLREAFYLTFYACRNYQKVRNLSTAHHCKYETVIFGHCSVS